MAWRDKLLGLNQWPAPYERFCLFGIIKIFLTISTRFLQEDNCKNVKAKWDEAFSWMWMSSQRMEDTFHCFFVFCFRNSIFHHYLFLRVLVNIKFNTWVSTFHQVCLFSFPSSWCGVDRLLLRESCPFNILRAKIYALNNLSFLGLKSINWIILPLGPGSCPTCFVSNQGRGKAAKGFDLEEPCHLKPLPLNFQSNCQYKMREITQENSCALKNHSIHPRVLRIIC